jgi:DNA mismatch repair protein MutS
MLATCTPSWRGCWSTSRRSHTRDGGMIRAGADAELDRQHGLRDGGREALAAIETRERERTGIANLRVQHNRVFGYFIEVMKSQLARVPADYIRKQTMTNAERYVTPELAEHETAVLGAQAAALEREQQLFAGAARAGQRGGRAAVPGRRGAGAARRARGAGRGRRGARARAARAVRGAGAGDRGGPPPGGRAHARGGSLRAEQPGLRAHAGAMGTLARFLLVTGPNMGGKSTVMRMAALVGDPGPRGLVRAGRAGAGRDRRPGVYAGRRGRRPRPRRQHLHGRDARDGGDPEPGDAAIAGAARRDRPRHGDLRRAGAGVGDHRVHPRSGRLPDDVRDPLSRAHGAVGQAGRAAQRARRGARGARDDRVPAPRRAGAAERSYGIQVGRLAGLPASVLRRAHKLLGGSRPATARDACRSSTCSSRPVERDRDDPHARAHEAILADLRACTRTS